MHNKRILREQSKQNLPLGYEDGHAMKRTCSRGCPLTSTVVLKAPYAARLYKGIVLSISKCPYILINPQHERSVDHLMFI
jgi:hypothetical protein